MGKVAVQEYKAFVRFVLYTCLQHIATWRCRICPVLGITDSADFTFFKQGCICITPDEVDVTRHQRVVEPAVAFQQQGILLTHEVHVVGY